ncbi:DUF1177 domain-containing protein [Brachybacterium halotolerans subsp. kimchii]|uniref:DUF1177 domain-containing protein n=1 Tax=Brachybacterium halotolerans TaxID=2795215 RepID=UPI001E32795E|nr:DUF1177 domain-containing protein [Brachybacterium halotolerans]UEJ81841.1 DUF1177 domain-containing protein [Brachybacterium halotolerans subsp. kimchii]
MSFSHLIAAYDLLDDPAVRGDSVAAHLRGISPHAQVEVEAVTEEAGTTDFLRVVIPGTEGKRSGGSAPTLGILGRLGGLGARPEQIGFVSDGDGALSAVTIAAKLLAMAERGERLPGDVIVATHIDPDAPTQPHDPVPFMGSVVEQEVSNTHEVSAEMDAILSIDTTKGNRVLNHKGIAITPTIADGWILRVSESLLDIVNRTTGRLPAVMPITMQDITPYGNDVYHVNSIVQPCTATEAPVVGVAIVTESAVPGSATGATDLHDVDQAVRFAIETAKDFGRGIATFHAPEELERLQALYGSMSALRTQGR